jgi:hypothetical protein
VPPLVEDPVLGPEFDRLTEAFTAQVFSAESDIHADITSMRVRHLKGT